MIFNSIDFLIFLPVVFLLYWFLFSKNVKWQNGFLLSANMFFYGFWDWRFLGLLLITAGTTYLAGLIIGRTKTGKSKRDWWIVFLTIVLNIGILFYFKYFNFFIQSFIDVFTFFGKDISIGPLMIILPVGISFYTFTSLSYVFDVYSGKVKPTKDIFAYLSFVTFFPALLSGPISRATKQLPQYFVKREFNYDQAIKGSKMLLWGFFMKLCVADRLGLYVDAVYGNVDHHNGTTLILAALLYSFQIYADFGGYSLLGIGTGKLLGINLQTNFIRPYFATTITEFWRRWHISLTTWFRDYIYFPMGGNRVTKAKWMLNIMVVFLVSGIWHGAAYTFLIWGALHGVTLIVEKLIYGDKLKINSQKNFLISILQIILTFTIVTIAWIFFRAESFGTAIEIIAKIFTLQGSVFVEPAVFALGGISLMLLFLKDTIDEINYRKNRVKVHHPIVKFIFWTLLVLFIMAFGIFDGGQFIYFQF